MNDTTLFQKLNDSYDIDASVYETIALNEEEKYEDPQAF
jgi:hypothetical protein